MKLTAPNDWHHDACGCNLCVADRNHLAEEVVITNLSYVATVDDLTPFFHPQRISMPTLPISASLLAGIGSIALGVYQLTQGNLTGGFGLIMAGVTALHHHQTVQSLTADSATVPAPPK